MIQLRKNMALLIILTILFFQVPYNVSMVHAESDSNATFTLEAPKNGTAQEIIESTYPLNNQTQIEVKPTIKLTFKYPVEIIDKTKISLETGDETYILDSEEIYLLQDEKTLCVDVGRIGKLPLRRNTLYRITISKDAVKLKDYYQ